MTEHANAIVINCLHFYPAICVACNNNHLECVMPTQILTATVANIHANLQPNPGLYGQKSSHPWFMQARTQSNLSLQPYKPSLTLVYKRSIISVYRQINPA